MGESKEGVLRLDFDHLRLHIPDAKAGQREQPITPELAEILANEREMREDSAGWIFPSPRPGASSTGYRDRMSKPFRRAVARAGLDPEVITPHVMRPTAITKLVEAGVDLPTIQRISGHKSVEMVLRYTHVHGRHIDEAIKAIGRGLPEPMANDSGGTMTHGRHKPERRVNSATTRKPLKSGQFQRLKMVAEEGLEPPTHGL